MLQDSFLRYPCFCQTDEYFRILIQLKAGFLSFLHTQMVAFITHFFNFPLFFFLFRCMRVCVAVFFAYQLKLPFKLIEQFSITNVRVFSLVWRGKLESTVCPLICWFSFTAPRGAGKGSKWQFMSISIEVTALLTGCGIILGEGQGRKPNKSSLCSQPNCQS